jgi:hypothetical protein
MTRAFALLALLPFSSFTVVAQDKAGPTNVAPGKYRCVFFINGALQNTPGFTIDADGSYTHDSGNKGKYTYNAAQSLIEFQGGSLDKQAGKVEAKENRAVIRLYNERRSRTVIDCDNARK